MNNFKIIRLSKTNLYLLTLAQGYMLIDCGYEKDRDLFVSRLKSLDIGIDEIQYLFLTHHHDDHSGLTNFLTGKNPSIRVIMHQRCKDLISTGMNERAENGGWCSRTAGFVAEFYHSFHPEWTLTFPPYTVRDGDYVIQGEEDTILSDIGLNARVLFTPGHTPDSISILDSSGNLFCGDAAANYLKWAGTGYSPVYISDLQEYYKSWGKIIASGVRMLHPAHGRPFPVDKLIKQKGRIRELADFNWD